MTIHDIEADTDPASNFTGHNRQLETRLYKRSGHLGEDDEAGPRLFE
jgi:hypothetical protein